MTDVSLPENKQTPYPKLLKNKINYTFNNYILNYKCYLKCVGNISGACNITAL